MTEPTKPQAADHDPNFASVQIDDPQLRVVLAASTMKVIPQTAALGFRFIKFERARAWGTLPWRADLVGDSDSGVIAGGAITTILDNVCGGSVQAALSEAVPSVTLDLRIDYMRPAETKRDIFCTAHCYKVTRTICFVRGAAYHDDVDNPIATAAATFIMVGAERGIVGGPTSAATLKGSA